MRGENTLLVANYGMGIRLVDTSDKTAPREVAFCLPTRNMGEACKMDCGVVGRQTWGSYFGSDGLIYASDIELGLFIVNPAGNGAADTRSAASIAGAARWIEAEDDRSIDLRVARRGGGYEISFAAGDGVPARAALYDVSGRKVVDLDASARGASSGGRRMLRWNGRDETGAPVARGIYFVRADAAGRAASVKLLHLGE